MKELISKSELADIVQKLADQLNIDYKNKKPILVGILNGSVVFVADLIRQLDFDLEIDFIATSSYEGTESSGTIRLIKDLKMDILNRDILLIEDVIDTGLTLSYLVKTLKLRNPKTLKVVTLLDKPSKRKVKYKADYIGKEIEDNFVVGYGLDVDEKYRQLPYIAIYE